MDLALSYLGALAGSGYFERAHTSCDGIWFEGHPACRDGATWNSVTQRLIDGGLLVRKVLPLEVQERLTLLPKDTLDAWWFELRPKGRKALERVR